MADAKGAAPRHENYLTLFWRERGTLGALVAITSAGAGLTQPPTARKSGAGVLFEGENGELAGFNLPDARAFGLTLREGLNRPTADLLAKAGQALGVDLSAFADKTPFVVGRVTKAEQVGHVRACEVDVGKADPQQIVCGGRNVREGMAVAVVLPGGLVADGKAVFAKNTYGRPSAGMICSARELGLTHQDSDGNILELPADDRPGRAYLEVYGEK